MALATGPFTSSFPTGNPVPKGLLFAQAQDGDAEALNALAGTGPGAGPKVVQSGTMASASTGAFPIAATAALAIAAVGAPAVGDGVRIVARCKVLAAAVADCAFYEAQATVLNLAGTLTIVGAVIASSQSMEGAAGMDGVLTIAAGIPTFTVTTATANAASVRVEWYTEALSGLF